MGSLLQLVPSSSCFQCDVCCRFPERTSFLRPFFTAQEIAKAISLGIRREQFPDENGCQIEVVPHPAGQGYLCPAFDPHTSHCTIYEARPLDCQLYPFVIMWDAEGKEVLMGMDLKCPFLTSIGVKLDGANLPSAVVDYSKQVQAFLEQESTLKILETHPRLITPFQDDVVIIAPLRRVTGRVGLR